MMIKKLVQRHEQIIMITLVFLGTVFTLIKKKWIVLVLMCPPLILLRGRQKKMFSIVAISAFVSVLFLLQRKKYDGFFHFLGFEGASDKEKEEVQTAAQSFEKMLKTFKEEKFVYFYHLKKEKPLHGLERLIESKYISNVANLLGMKSFFICSDTIIAVGNRAKKVVLLFESEDEVVYETRDNDDDKDYSLKEAMFNNYKKSKYGHICFGVHTSFFYKITLEEFDDFVGNLSKEEAFEKFLRKYIIEVMYEDRAINAEKLYIIFGEYVFLVEPSNKHVICEKG